MAIRKFIRTFPPPTEKLWWKYPKEHNSWMAMRRRCYDPDDPSFERYGAIGVTVCVAWRESFEAFFADVGPAPSPEHTIDRFPNKGGDYERGNVRWATRTEQARNTRRARMLEWHGVTLSVAEWAERTGINSNTILSRLRAGRNVADALSAPVLRQTDTD